MKKFVNDFVPCIIDVREAVNHGGFPPGAINLHRMVHPINGQLLKNEMEILNVSDFVDMFNAGICNMVILAKREHAKIVKSFSKTNLRYLRLNTILREYAQMKKRYSIC